jgi:hypothetical protein
VIPLRGARQEPLGTLARRVGELVATELRYALRRRRDTIMAAFREEHEEWDEGPDGSLSLAFSDSCPRIVGHVATVALMASRRRLESHVLPNAGYGIASDSRWALRWVPPARVACWGGVDGPERPTRFGPFVRTDSDDPDPEAAAFGWREVPPSGAATDDVVTRHARVTGLCACDVCTGMRRFGVTNSRQRAIGNPSRRAAREPLLRRVRERLDGLDAGRLSAVLADLEAWDWIPPWPPSLEALRSDLGRPCPDAVELAAMLALVATPR